MPIPLAVRTWRGGAVLQLLFRRPQVCGPQGFRVCLTLSWGLLTPEPGRLHPQSVWFCRSGAGVRTCVANTSGAAARPVPTTLRSTDTAHSGGSVQVQRVEGVLSVESQLEMYSEGGAGDWLYSLSVWSKVNLTGKDITV